MAGEFSGVGWDADPVVAAWSGLPSLDRAVTADACVVGLGGSGLAAVEEFAARGFSVVGVDAGRVAGGAAGRNGGFLLGGGAPAFHEAQRLWGADAALSLYRATLAELTHLHDVLGDEVIRRVGSIRLAGLPGGPADEAEALDRDRELADCRLQYDALRAAGIAVETYDGPLGQGLYLPDDAAMCPPRRALGLAVAATSGSAAPGSASPGLPGRVELFENSPVVSLGSGVVRTTAGSRVGGNGGRGRRRAPRGAPARPGSAGADRPAADAGDRAARRARPVAVSGLRALGLRLRPAGCVGPAVRRRRPGQGRRGGVDAGNGAHPGRAVLDRAGRGTDGRGTARGDAPLGRVGRLHLGRKGSVHPRRGGGGRVRRLQRHRQPGRSGRHPRSGRTPGGRNPAAALLHVQPGCRVRCRCHVRPGCNIWPGCRVHVRAAPAVFPSGRPSRVDCRYER